MFYVISGLIKRKLRFTRGVFIQLSGGGFRQRSHLSANSWLESQFRLVVGVVPWSREHRNTPTSARLLGKPASLAASLQMTQMAVEDEMTLMWGHVLPSLLTPKTQTGDGMPLQSEGAKRKPEHQGKRPPGKGTGKGRGRQRGNGADSSHGRLAHQQPDLLDLLIKLVLRHEAFLGRLQQDMVYIFTFKNQPNAPDSLLPVLYQVSQEWREKYQTNPSSLDRSLRVTILLCLLTELLKRHRRLEATGAEEALKAIKGAGWMSEDGKWVHQMWNHAEAKLVTDEARGTMTLAEGTEHLRTMLRLLAQPEILLKFAATRPLAQEMSGHQISFICELSLRHPAADQMFAMMGKLVGNAMLHLVGLRIQSSRGRISELAAQIQERLYSRCCA